MARAAKDSRRGVGNLPRSREKRRICVLDARCGSDLAHFSQQQLCYGPTCRHKHITRDGAQGLIKSGDYQWLGSGNNVLVSTREMHWENRNGAMQLILGNSSKPGPRQHCQKMPQLSTAMGSQVAMRNDGRID